MTVTNIVDISADPDDVWAVLADLPATRCWLPGVVAARVDGDVRLCTMTDGQEIHKRSSDLSAEQRSYRSEHLRVPLPVQHSGGTFTVTTGAAAGTGQGMASPRLARPPAAGIAPSHASGSGNGRAGWFNGEATGR